MTDRKKHRMPRTLGLAGAAVAVAAGVWLGGTAIASSTGRAAQSSAQPSAGPRVTRTPPSTRPPSTRPPSTRPSAVPSRTRTPASPVPPVRQRLAKPVPSPCTVRPAKRPKPRPVPTRSPRCLPRPDRIPTVPGLG